MDRDKASGAHDGKGAPAPGEVKDSVGKAVGYSDQEPKEKVTGRDGLIDAPAVPPTVGEDGP